MNLSFLINYVPYNYKHSGKELQETGMYDFGWRQYMPDIGRWNGMDQLSEMYAPVSPYAYVANNPVSLMDPDGRKIEPIYDKDDKITGWTFTEGDATAVGGYLKYGGDWGKLASQLDEYGSNFGTGPLSTFWNTFNSNGAMIWANSVSTGDIGGTLSNGVIALGEATITSKGTSFEEWVKGLNKGQSNLGSWFKEHFEVSGGGELSFGAQLGVGFKKGLAARIDLWSMVISDFNISNKIDRLSAFNERESNEFKVNQGIGGAYYGGVDYKAQTFEGITTHEIAAGILGFGGNVVFDSNGDVTDWFWGFDPSLNMEFIIGLELNFRIGFSK